MRGRTIAALAVAALSIGAGVWAASATDGSPLAVPAARAATPSDAALRDADIALFAARAAEDPHSGSDRARLAGLYLQRGRETGDYEDYRRAEGAARASLDARGHRNAGARMILASSLLAQHRFAEARAAAEALVAAEPEKPSYRALLGEIQLELGDHAAARGTFGSLEAEEENLAVAPRLARWAEVRGDVHRARRILRDAARRADARGDLPAEQRAWFHLRVGDLEARHGWLGRAEYAFRAGLAVNPGDARLYAALARLEWQRQRWARVIAYGELAGGRADLATLAVLGDARAALGDADAAEALYARVEADHAANPEPYARQWTQFRLDHRRDLPETLEVLRREIEGRRDVLGHDLLAWALYLNGRPAAAREAIRPALAAGTRDAALHFHAGMIERALGDERAAREHLSRALEINPRFHPEQADVARAALRGKRLPRGWE